MKPWKKARIAVLIVFLLTLISGVGWMAFQTKQNDYRDTKIKAFLEENPMLEQGGTVFLGDSLTDLCDLDMYYPTRGYINRGIGGDTTEGVLRRFDATVLPLAPSTIVLLIGINDFNHGRSLDATLQSYERLINHILDVLPDVRLVVLSLPPVNGSSYPPLLLLPDKIEAFNVQLETLALDYGATWVDIHAPLLQIGSDLLDPAYSDDGLHWNALGYDIVAALVQTALTP
jgi:lysophospholipase L1-like esterase